MSHVGVGEISGAGTLMRRPGSITLRFLAVFTFLVVLGQAALVVHARPQDLITGAHGMADFLSRAFLPDFRKLRDAA